MCAKFSTLSCIADYDTWWTVCIFKKKEAKLFLPLSLQSVCVISRVQKITCRSTHLRGTLNKFTLIRFSFTLHWLAISFFVNNLILKIWEITIWLSSTFVGIERGEHIRTVLTISEWTINHVMFFKCDLKWQKTFIIHLFIHTWDRWMSHILPSVSVLN